jgi:hypothetical protein
MYPLKSNSSTKSSRLSASEKTKMSQPSTHIQFSRERLGVQPPDQPTKETTSRSAFPLSFVLLLTVLMMLGAASAQTTGQHAFGFNSSNISGFPSGSVRLTGGGAFNLATGFVKSAGGFRCTSDVNQGPLAGCQAAQGVRWDTAALLSSTNFKCTGKVEEPLKTAFTSADTVVLKADFYRAGDGNDESFTANMIVSDHDLAPDVPGTQNAWIQGVGCGRAVVTFNQ